MPAASSDLSQPFIVHSCVFGGEQAPTLYEGSLPPQGSLEPSRFLWVHLDATDQQAVKDWLKIYRPSLLPIEIDALVADETRPRFAEFDNGCLLILRGINTNQNAEPEDMISVRIWIEDTIVISVRRRKLAAAQALREKFASGGGPKNIGDLIIALATQLSDHIELFLDDLDERTDQMEERVIETPEASERHDIIALRQQAITVRRYIIPQREALAHVRNSEQAWLDPLQKRRLQEVTDSVTRHIENLDALRERSQIIKDELSNILAERMNKIMYILSVVAAIFLPLGFLTGLMGVNLGGIPGAENPFAFLYFAITLIVLVAVQMLVFKVLRWF